MGDLAKWKAVSTFLMEEKVVYKMKLKADQLLVHPQNRGGMGLQVFSMHAKGQRILQCGCDLSLLSGSTCIELSPDPIKRKAQCKMMQSLHDAHPDYVAPVSGHERFMSLSSSHVSQFFKAMLHGCKSPESELIDGKSGKMSLALVSDPEFLKGANEGWDWTIIPFYLEDAYAWLIVHFCLFPWSSHSFFVLCTHPMKSSLALQDCFPTLPILIQGALNATNICFEAVGEVELLSTIAMRANQILQDGGEPDFVKIAQLSAAGSVGLYAHVLGKFVQSFGGGAPFEILGYLATFSHQDKAVTLGKEFVMAITECEFSPVHLFPLVRIAFAVTNLTAPKQKVQDGFSRLLTRTDVQALKGKKNLPKLEELETLMEKAWKQTCSKADKALAYKAFGRLQCRSLLHVTKKSKHGHEDKTYADLNEIYNLFMAELNAPSQAASLQQNASSQSASPSASQISFDQAKDPMYLASLKLDLKLGNLVTHKDHPQKVFQIKAVNADGIQLQYLDPITNSTVELDVEASKLVALIKNCKGKLASVMSQNTLNVSFATVKCQPELEKCQAFMALMDMYKALDCNASQIQVMSGLSKIYANIDFKKGDLTLVPITSSASLLVHEKPSGFVPFMEWKAVKLYIMQPKAYKESKPNDGGIVAPFWIPRSDDENGNLDFSFVQHKTVKVLCLQNSKAIKKGEELLTKIKLSEHISNLEGKALEPKKKKQRKA